MTTLGEHTALEVLAAHPLNACESNHTQGPGRRGDHSGRRYVHYRPARSLRRRGWAALLLDGTLALTVEGADACRRYGITVDWSVVPGMGWRVGL